MAKPTPALVAKLKRRGIKYPVRTITAAARAGIPLSLACAELDQESGGGYNVFGHDPVAPPQIKGGPVTLRRYKLYKEMRKRGLGMQGVGPMQLTYYTLQDKADAAGGCHRPYINMLIGFEQLAALIKEHGRHAGIAAYNGSGPAARRYADQVEQRAAAWHRVLTPRRSR